MLLRFRYRDRRTFRLGLAFLVLALAWSGWAWGQIDCRTFVWPDAPECDTGHATHAACYLIRADAQLSIAGTFWPNFLDSTETPGDSHSIKNVDKFPVLMSNARNRIGSVLLLLQDCEEGPVYLFGGQWYAPLELALAFTSGWHPWDFPSDVADKCDQMDYSTRIFAAFPATNEWADDNYGIIKGAVDYAGSYARYAGQHIRDEIKAREQASPGEE